jgi:putative oxidoreductase
MSQPKSNRALRATLWVLQILLALAYLSFGYSKLVDAPAAAEIFDKVGWGDWFQYVVGVLEIAVAIPLLIPRYARRGAIALIALAVVAIGVHAAIGDPNGLVFVVPIVMASVVVWGRGKLSSRDNVRAGQSPVTESGSVSDPVAGG